MCEGGGGVLECNVLTNLVTFSGALIDTGFY